MYNFEYMKLTRVLFLFFEINLLILQANTELCDKCITPAPDNKNGTCVPAKYCKIFFDIVGVPINYFPDSFQKFVTNSKCTNDNVENYCCSYNFIDSAFYELNNKFCNTSIETEGTLNTPETLISPIIEQNVNVNKLNTNDLDLHPNLKLLPENCGLPADGDKVSHGIEADLDEYPFMVLLQYDKNKKNQFLCGGTLINENYVLTAAHCINSDLFSARLGEYDIDSEIDCQEPENDSYEDEYNETPIKSTCNHPVQDIPIQSIITHNYNNRTKENDIALLRLQRPANITANNIGFVCLPTTHDLRNAKYVSDKKSARVAGWGGTEMGTKSNILLKGVVNVNQERKKCENNYKKKYQITLNKNYLCAIGRGRGNATDTCRGNSGGPLLRKMMKTNIETNEREFQYGIVSTGPKIKCGMVLDIGGALYTNVPEYMRWILDNLKP